MSGEVLPPADEVSAEACGARPEMKVLRESARWNPENFAREQIRGLVRQVFFSNAARPVRQVIFSAVEPASDLRGLCRSVGDALALETSATVAVVGGYPCLLHGPETHGEEPAKAGIEDVMPLRRIAARVRANLWLVPDGASGASASAASLHSYLGEVRRQFEYSIVQGPSANESDQTTAMAQFADGIILVLSAHHTRRAAAGKVKGALEAAHVRILGAVLSDRMFPIPEPIYRRL
jgi:hypothetical protein